MNIGRREIKPRNFESNIPQSRRAERVDVGSAAGSMDRVTEHAKQKTGGPMAIRKIGRKIFSIGATIVGATTGITLGAGESLTGEIIIDAVLIAGAVVIVLVNGRDGVPDWLVDILKSMFTADKSK